MKPQKSWSHHHPHHQQNTKSRDCKHGMILPVAIFVALMVNLTGIVLFFMPLKEPMLFHGFFTVQPKPQKDKLLGGLLHSGFDEGSCQSRYESVEYLKELKRKPSSYLISKLRSYEALHRRCGPYTESYNKSVKLITSGGELSPTDCKYVVWIPFSGLGNRILAITSAFLYAILTNRVILIDPRDYTSDLFCEPFPGTSWYLPKDFPVIEHFYTFDHNFSYCHGYMIKNNLIDESSVSEMPAFLYLNLIFDMDQYDDLFYRNDEQMFLKKVPWLTMKSDEYFVPSLFMIEYFKKDLENMFPDKESVFHILGRYLFHPTNPVWGLITRYHQAYLAKADEKIGIQVRVFYGSTPFQHVLDQIVACTMEENILPQINQDNPLPTPNNNNSEKRTKAVLVTSLSSSYADVIRDIYLQHSTVTAEVIQVFQPSHEEFQKMQNENHYIKALAEMYLLAMSDTLVTSGHSTFGYVAQGLGGLRPWVMYLPVNFTAPKPPCERVISMEPCFHLPPLDHTMANVPFLMPCEDRFSGRKLYQDSIPNSQ